MLRRSSVTAVALVGLLALAGCGSGGSASTAGSTPASGAEQSTTSDAAGPTSTVVKPTVSLPATQPTELVTTVITPGSGHAAAAGDVVVVNYVGVRSADGTMFDNSYDRGEPYPVQLGAGSVIKGWDQGLVGVQVGRARAARHPRGPGVRRQPVRARSSSPATRCRSSSTWSRSSRPPRPRTSRRSPSPARRTAAIWWSPIWSRAPEPRWRPARPRCCSSSPTAATPGRRCSAPGSRVQPLSFKYGVDQLLPGIVDGIKDMKVGGRRQLTVPFAQGFGTEGNESLGLPGIDRRRPGRRPRRCLLSCRGGAQVVRRSRPMSSTCRRVGELADGDVVDTGSAD